MLLLPTKFGEEAKCKKDGKFTKPMSVAYDMKRALAAFVVEEGGTRRALFCPYMRNLVEHARHEGRLALFSRRSVLLAQPMHVFVWVQR